MNITQFTAMMESIAPRELAMDWDNVGLLIGTERQEIRRVLVALDCTMDTANEAIEWGADLLLVHHPVFLGGVKAISPAAPDTAAAYALIRHGIALFAAHTNLDAAGGGVNDCLAEALGLIDVSPLPPDNLGRIGSLPEAMPFKELAAMAELRLNTRVRITGREDAPIRRLAMIGGAGAGDVLHAHEAGADAYITGEMKHHMALQAEFLGLNIIEAGHYETERVALEPLIRRLQGLSNDVQYKLTRCEKACLRGIQQEVTA